MLPSHFHLLCALLSEIAYLDAEAAEKQATAIGCWDFRFYNDTNTDTQAISVVKDDHVIVAFRGTSSWRDVKTDIDASFIQHYPPVTDIETGRKIRLDFHRGFFFAADSIDLDYNALFSNIIGVAGVKNIIFTGHSLAGALAQITAIRFATHSPNHTHIHLITFGSPAVANTDTADILWDAIFTCTMYEMDGDPVPHTPPNFLGYQHLRQRTLIPLPHLRASRGACHFHPLRHPLPGTAPDQTCRSSYLGNRTTGSHAFP